MKQPANAAAGRTARWIWLALSIAVGALFVYAGAAKVLDPVGFAGDIENFHLVPWSLGVRLAFYLPWLEILCGAALILRRLEAGAVGLLLALMIVFIAATVAAKARGIDVSCGCFGHTAKPLTFATHLLVDLAILGALIALAARLLVPREKLD